MARIQLLSEEVRNRIAAGEVLERPASAVKELVENAIDAGATSIDIDIEDGGVGLIRVSDNGSGIQPDELPTALLRHATSKIASVDDIFRITTMGFRGEALPSLASVSHMEIVSRPHNAASAMRIAATAGEVTAEGPAARAPGTAVIARDLFFNTPARRKFLKSAAAEVAAITEMLVRLALPHPEIAFRATNGGRLMLELPAQADVLSRVGSLFGASVAQKLIAVNHVADEGFMVSGFVAPPTETRTTRKMIYTFLNRRWIQSNSVASAVRREYETLIPKGRFPLAFLFLGISPDRVDVNVHPAKIEVRFQDERNVFGAVARAVRSALHGVDLTPPYPVESHSGPHADESDAGPLSSVHVTPPRCAVAAPAMPASGGTQPLPVASVAHGTRGMQAVAPERASPSIPEQPASVSAAHATVPVRPTGQVPVAGVPLVLESPREQKPLFEARAATRKPQYRILGQAHDSFLVVEFPGGIRLIDQHALHERILYEALKSGRTGMHAAQQMLIPAIAELSIAEYAIFLEVRDSLAQVGFVVEEFGERTVSIQAAPAILKGRKVAEVLRDTLAALADTGRAGLDRLERLLKTMACKAAVKAGDALAEADVLALLERAETDPALLTCPHGRPCTVTIGLDELQRKFHR